MPLEPSGRVPADWLPATGLPPGTAGLMASRAGGVSLPPFAGLNLRPPCLPGAPHDAVAAVLENQRRFAAALHGATPVYLDQVHGCRVVRLTAADTQTQPEHGPLHQADASITTERGLACTVLVADCLPVLLACADGQAVGAAHAGWRGLCGGVLEATVAALTAASGCAPAQLVAWLGACIGPQQFEVGDEVRDAFGPTAQAFFRPGLAPGKWWADLPGLARQRLAQLGVTQVHGGQWCTVSAPSRFFSFRRDRVTGRHAAAIWRC